MSSPFVGEIRMFGGNFAPAGWAFCNGSIIPIAENETLFQLIGTTYGGDGQETFALPDLRGRLPMHRGNGFLIGENAGTETETLTVNQIPAHNHVPQAASSAGNSASPAGNIWASASLNPYSTGAANAAMSAAACGTTGGSQPHDNLMPYLAVTFIISLFGIFPSQN
jgi:microcystin-dependent protein